MEKNTPLIDIFVFMQACTYELSDYNDGPMVRSDNMSDPEEMKNSQEFLNEQSEDDQMGGLESIEELQVELDHPNEAGCAFHSEPDTLIGCRESEMSNDLYQEATQELLRTDPGDAEIDVDLAAFIQRLMATPEKRLEALYDNTNNPYNIPALREIKLSPDATDSTMTCAQNYMLKGVTKVAYIMDAIYKNIDRVPPEMNLRSLMSNFNDAMRFFGAANLKMTQQESSSSRLKDPCLQWNSTASVSI